MKVGICTIQRNRGKWIKEWVTFHHVVGITHFYIYLHKCTDNSKEIVTELQKIFNIQCFVVNEDTIRPQLVAYEHAYQTFGHEIDWMAFIDGDEFLYPSSANALTDVLKDFEYQKLSALGVYWQCFGSNGHLADPDGLVIEDYSRRAPLDFPSNRHIKSIVRGGQGHHCISAGNAHLFKTIYGTVDELMRPIDKGLMSELHPSYEKIRINHYAVQSRDFFINFKKRSGAADAGSDVIREETWWQTYDRNEETDTTILRYQATVKRTLSSLPFTQVHHETNTSN
jgi:hypothetical protein